MDLKLTENQKELVCKNHNLIYAFLKAHGLCASEGEDWYGVAAEGLCKAARAFRAESGVRFSTLAYVCMENEIKKVMRRHNGLSVCSLDEPAAPDEDYLLGEAVAELRDFTMEVELRADIGSALEALSVRDRKIMALLFKGARHKQVAAAAGVSQSTVSRVCSRFLIRVLGDGWRGGRGR